MSRKWNRGNWVGREKDPLIPTQMNRTRQVAKRDLPDLGWHETVGARLQHYSPLHESQPLA
jgi:hypothetical protein